MDAEITWHENISKIIIFIGVSYNDNTFDSRPKDMGTIPITPAK